MHRMRFVKILCVVPILLLGFLFYVDKTVSLKSLRIVCLGDSTTYGHRLQDPLSQSYPARLSVQARGSWEVLNCGVNGATVLQKGDIPIISQNVYQRAIVSRQDVVVLMLGTNDSKDTNWRYANEFVADYVALVQKLQGLSSHPHVIACSIPPIFIDYPNGLTAKRDLEINDLLKEAMLTSGADFLDIYTPLSQEPSFFTDGVHPNTRGAQEIATLVFNKIKSL